MLVVFVVIVSALGGLLAIYEFRTIFECIVDDGLNSRFSVEKATGGLVFVSASDPKSTRICNYAPMG